MTDFFKFADKVNLILGTRKNPPQHKMAFISFIETPIGLLNMRSILETACEQNLPFKTEAVVFGSDDFLASIGKNFNFIPSPSNTRDK